jgi:hypothetical protein
MQIGNYILIKNKYIGKIIKFLWNHTSIIVKLEGYTDYIDPTIKNYNLLENKKIEGYMLVTINNNIINLTDNLLENNIKSYAESFDKISVKIQINFNKYIQSIQNKSLNIIETNALNITENVNGLNNREKNNASNKKPDNLLKISKNKINKYQKQDMKEDDYQKYIINMINNLFKDKKQLYEDLFLSSNLALYKKSVDYLGEDNINNILKPLLTQILEKYYSINEEEYYDLKNTLMYKHLIFDNEMDTLSLGKQLIIKIKEQMYDLQNKLRLDTEKPDIENFSEKTNLFDFIKFKIVGDYIELTNINNIDEEFRTITRDLIPNLSILQDEYGKKIDYSKLMNIILANKTPEDIIKNQDIIKEAIKILSQEYFICLQPKVELLLWTICRLLVCWYSDKHLYDRIYKVKILINLYRSRGLKEFNQDYDVLPIITVIPKYGKEEAIKVGSYLSYYFFVYKKLGNDESEPTYFNKLDDLMYYTNGSLDIKKHVKFILKSNKNTAKLVKEYQIKIENKEDIQKMDIQERINLKIENKEEIQNLNIQERINLNNLI